MLPSLLFSVSFLSPCFFLYLLGSFEVTVTSVSLPPFVSRRGLSNTNQRLSLSHQRNGFFILAALTEGGINQALADAGLPPAQAIQTKVHTSDRVPDASPAPHQDDSWGVNALSGTWVTVLLGFAGCTCFGFGMCLFSHLRRVRRPPSPPPSPPMMPGASARTQPLGAQSHEPDSITDSMVEAQVVRGVPMRVMSQRMEDVMEEAAAPIYPPPYPVVVRNGEGHVTVSLRSVEAHAAAETPDAGIPSAPPAPVYGQVWNGVS